MMKSIAPACLLAGTLGATALAQTPISPQQSRERSPNMPPTQEIVPERIRPSDPETTGTIRRPAPSHEGPKIEDGGKRPS